MFRIKNRMLLLLRLSALSSFGVHADTQNFNVEKIPEIEKASPAHAHPATRVTSAVTVGCSQADLTAAIVDGNTEGTAVLQLPSNCTYTVQIPATASEAFPVITGDITIIGGENTVIERDTGAAAFRIFTVNVGGVLTLQQLTIKHGNTAGLGGGILNNGTLSVESVTLSQNNATNGGAISVTAGATAEVLTSTLLANTTTGVGGGAIINFGTLDVQNSYLSGNTAPVNGGAINTQPGGTTTLLLSLVTNNTSVGLGGGLSNLGTTNIDQSIVNYNTGSAGGGIATGNNNVFISATSNTAILGNQTTNCSPLNTIPGCHN